MNLEDSVPQSCPSSQSHDVLAYIDGAASAAVVAHVDGCSDCRQAASILAELQGQLAQRLYRFDCPQPHALGEYALDLVPQAERTAVARHTLACAECTSELRSLRAFLTVDPPVVTPFVERARRVLARLVSSPDFAPGALGSRLRDSEAASSKIYRVDDVSISLIQGPGEGELTGMVARDVTGPETVAGTDVYLIDADGSRRVARIGAAGEFSVAPIPTTTYELELHLQDRVLVIPGIRFDNP